MPGRPHYGDRAATLARAIHSLSGARCQGYWRSCADEGHRPVLGTPAGWVSGVARQTAHPAAEAA
jgi:hypothetical protein